MKKARKNVNYKNIEKKRLDAEQYVFLILHATKLEINVCRENIGWKHRIFPKYFYHTIVRRN